jgi:two-component sensor histidine kinase
MNNIYSLLILHAETLHEPTAISALNDAAKRVQSMKVLYDKLYRSSNFQKLSVADYLPALVDEILSNFPNSNKVTVEKKIDDFVLDAKRLQPLGIVINELLTNIMKYAFTGRNDGLIIIEVELKPALTGNGKTIFIAIQDNGNGMPEAINFENSTGFGLMLVNMLTQQLNGSIRIERSNGTKIMLEFEL